MHRSWLMKLPVQISFRHLYKSDAVERFVAAKAARLEKLTPQIVRCAVVIDAPHRQHRQGYLFHVRVRLTLPGGELVAARDPAQHQAHEDVLVAVRDAFRAVRRELDARLRVRRHEVKRRGPRAAEGSSGSPPA
jgi:ribosome-associated translation inhibitor RaiA